MSIPMQPSATPAPKPVNAMSEAVKLQAALEKIDKRERSAANNAAVRYQAERNALLTAASAAAIRIIEAAQSEVAP